MRAIGDPRAFAALTRSGETLLRKCFVRNSFSGPGGRGRGAGIGVPTGGPTGANASGSAEGDTSSIGLGRGQVIDATTEVADNEVGNWREVVQRRISMLDVQSRAADGATAGRGRGIGVASAPEGIGVGGGKFRIPSAQSDGSSEFGTGRGIPVPPQNAGRGRGIPLPGPLGAACRGIPQSPLGSSLDVEKVQTDTFDHSEEDSAVIASPLKVDIPTPAPPRIFVSPQITVPSLGRGRGSVDVTAQPTIGAESEISQQYGSEGREAGRGLSPREKRPQLTAEEARARAIAILQEGIEKNVAAEGERRRKAGMEKFADATEYFADRFKREPGQAPSQVQRTRKERERSKRTARPRGPSTSDELAVAEPSVEEQLTPEQEAELLRLDNETTFKENLHRLFLVQFEPEYAMEDFGRNPDIEELPVLSLEEYLHSLKSMFLPDSAGFSEEQKWQEAVQQSLANAPQLEKLVAAYAGPGRITARTQIQKLEAISEKLPETVPPEVSAFTQRALITLQNNPGLTFQQKERLMKNLVSGFSSL